jgi:hypothetical protein
MLLTDASARRRDSYGFIDAQTDAPPSKPMKLTGGLRRPQLIGKALGGDNVRTAICTLGIASVLLWPISALCQGGSSDPIAASHIEANVPPPGDFDRILHRDLEAYFGSKGAGGHVSVEYELLRQGPTQSGVAYPKFYAWVQVQEGGRLLRAGAVRLAAIERQRFEITDFLLADEIRRSPDAITKVFPAPVCDRIQEKVGLGNRSDIPPNPRIWTPRARTR